MKKKILLLLFIVYGYSSYSQESNYRTKSDINYYSEAICKTNEYIRERCILDIYYPENIAGFPTIVWFHGGGLSSGEKDIPGILKEKGFCIIAPNYRLSPRAKTPDFIEDAAAAIAWVFNNISKYGGDPSLIFVSGHSAGGYLALMTGLDKKWLAKHDIDADKIAGLLPFSGHTITHFTTRKERGIKDTQPVVDEFAPLFHVRADAAPLWLITGDREMEILGRYEENAYLMRMMKIAGHKATKLYELQGYGHGMTEPAFPLLIREVRLRTKEIKGSD